MPQSSSDPISECPLPIFGNGDYCRSAKHIGQTSQFVNCPLCCDRDRCAGTQHGFQLAGKKQAGHAGACPVESKRDYAPAPLEKLPTASASVLYTSKTVRSFVIWRTS